MTTNPQNLKLLEMLELKPEEGTIYFKNRRVLIVEADALGVLRQELIAALGEERARCILTRFGYASGYQDALSLMDLFHWQTDEDWWQAGPILHTLEGIVKATRVKGSFDKKGKRFHSEVIWRNSYEAEQHLLRFGKSSTPVCWTLAGYASGYATAWFGSEIYYIEEECVGKGDSRCYVVGRSAGEWGDRITPHLQCFRAKDVRQEINQLMEEVRKKEQEVTLLKKALHQKKDSGEFIYTSKKMEEVIDLVSRVAVVDTNILLMGESGTGKELIARMIHQKSPRRAGPLVAINCAALTETLLESELFGHVKGAFTGATSDKKGLFEEANKGTLFLDEIGEISQALQVKLLRALQEKEIRRVGGNRSIKVDTRVLTATNRDIQEMVKIGQFRSDLFFRLNVISITVPPLRERKEDIVPLARYFIDKYSKTLGKKNISLSPKAMDLLMSYEWPGNVRELENVIERTIVLCTSHRIEAECLPPEIRTCAISPQEKAPQETPFQWSSLSLEEIEREHILQTLKKNQGNQMKTAKELGISYSTLWRKLKSYNVTDIPK